MGLKIQITACLVRLFYQYWCSSAFPLQIWVPQGCSQAHYQWRTEKGWLTTNLKQLQHIPALLKTSSQIYTDYWARNGSYQLWFWNLKTEIFNKQDEESNRKLRVSIFFTPCQLTSPHTRPPQTHPDFFSSLPLCSITLFMYSGTVSGNLQSRGFN